MNTTRKSQAIPRASHRTYAAKDHKIWNMPFDTHQMRNKSTDKYSPQKSQASIYGMKLWRGKNPDGSYYYYNSRGDIYPYDHKKIYRN